MKKIIQLSTIILAGALFFVSCKKKFDEPPVKQANDGARITIAGLKAKYTLNPFQNYRFQNDSNLYCVVTSDEVSGNLYKEVYVKDATGALHLNLVYSGGLFIGDSIRINLKGLYLNDDNNLIQLDSVNIEKSVVKLASGLNPQPEVMTISQIIASTSATNVVQSRLVKINNVEFSSPTYTTFADAIGKSDVNQTLKSCSAPTLTVRTSGYANFAGTALPTGNGSIVGIVSQYGTTMQLSIRNYNEVNMNGPVCTSTVPAGTYLSKDFEDLSISSSGWTQQNVIGSINWTAASFGSQNFAKCTNYGPPNVACETWLISPPVSIATSTNPNLYFQNACNYSGAQMEVWVSTNYVSGLPSTATWVQLSPTLSSGTWLFVNSGALSLSAYKTSTTRVAFKYVGSSTDGKTWEVDDIVIKEN